MEHIKGGCDQFKYSCLKCDDDSKMTMGELKIHLSKHCPYIVIPCDICSSGYIRQNHLYHHCNRSMNDIVQYFSPSKILELAHDILKGKKPKELGHNLCIISQTRALSKKRKVTTSTSLCLKIALAQSKTMAISRITLSKSKLTGKTCMPMSRRNQSMFLEDTTRKTKTSVIPKRNLLSTSAPWWKTCAKIQTVKSHGKTKNPRFSDTSRTTLIATRQSRKSSCQSSILITVAHVSKWWDTCNWSPCSMRPIPRCCCHSQTSRRRLWKIKDGSKIPSARTGIKGFVTKDRGAITLMGKGKLECLLEFSCIEPPCVASEKNAQTKPADTPTNLPRCVKKQTKWAP